MENSGLPKPNVSYEVQNPDALDDQTIKGMICNPIYAGIPPFQQIVSDEAWIQAASQLISEEGPEQFLVNMLYMLRQSMGSYANQAQPAAVAEETPLYCYHDDFPMIEVYGNYVCVAEYIFEHLEESPITDLVLEPELALVFQNGHTLPLLDPVSGHPFYVDNEDEFLTHFNGLSIIDIEWHDQSQGLILYFDSPGADLSESSIDDEASYIEQEFTEQEFIELGLTEQEFAEQELSGAVASLAVHLDSIRLMTCPYLS